MFHLKNNDLFQMTYSIIIPTYNSARVIKRCIDSIVSQSYADYEVLVMDGDSRDDTVKIANSFDDNRIKVYSELDKGIYDAMNKGIDKSQGEWLLFLGSDDYLFDFNVLANVSKRLTPKMDIVYGEVESHWSESHRGKWSLEKLEANRCHQAIFYNRRFFGKSCRYNLKYPILADFDMNLRWFLNNRYKHCYIPLLIAHFSDGGCSSQIQDTEFYKDWGLNKLRYNHHVLTPIFKKRAARQFVNANPDKPFINAVLIIYCHCLSIWQIVVGN